MSSLEELPKEYFRDIFSAKNMLAVTAVTKVKEAELRRQFEASVADKSEIEDPKSEIKKS
jgi:hypothetical protein